MRRLFTSPSTDSTSSVFQFGVHTNLIFLMCLRLIRKRKKLDGLGAPSNDLLTSIKSTDVLLMFTLSYDEKPEKATSGQEQQQQHDVLSAVWEKSRNVVKLRWHANLHKLSATCKVSTRSTMLASPTRHHTWTDYGEKRVWPDPERRRRESHDSSSWIAKSITHTQTTPFFLVYPPASSI